MATILHGLNPLSYRGYIFTPAAGICHYLGSRFYVPMLCRFMNADKHYDTYTGVVGANMFAYCNNNPIAFSDPTGEAFLGKTAVKAMAEYLLKKGLNGSIVHLSSIVPNQFIYCNSKNYTISENGNHYGVLFMGNVYCNIHPYGLPYESWVADFDARDGKKVAIYQLNWKFS